MAATGKTPILLYGSTTPTNAPTAGNLTNSTDGCEIAINVADKNLFFKDSTNTVNTVPIRQSSAGSNGWLSSTDWNTFNNKQPAGSYALTTGTLAQFAATTSAQLAGVISDETGSGSLVFGTSPTIATPTLTGNATLSNGNLVIGTSGKGIDFSATAGTGTSELLADYEEGTSTLTLTFGGGSTGITYNKQECRYTKIGNRVFIQAAIALSNKGSSTGEVVITGLPFTSANLGYTFNGLTIWAQNMAGLTGAIVPAVGENSTSIYTRQWSAFGTTTTLTEANFGNDSYIMLSGHYFV